MQLDEMPDDRHPEPEPVVPAAHRAVGLAETIEDERQELGEIPMPLSALDLRFTCSAATPTAALGESTRSG
jgi:hypothetical protein